jgi:hypothetical protein
VSNTINGSLTAGLNISVTTHGNVLGKAVSSNDSGGLISVNAANGHVTLSVTNTSPSAAARRSPRSAHRRQRRRHRRQSQLPAADHGRLVGLGRPLRRRQRRHVRLGRLPDEDEHERDDRRGRPRESSRRTRTSAAPTSGHGRRRRPRRLGTTNADLNIGQTNGLTQVDVQGSAEITGNHVLVAAVVDHSARVLNTRTHATAVGANSRPTGTIRVGGSTQVKLQNGAEIVGNVDTRSSPSTRTSTCTPPPTRAAPASAA